MLVAREGFEDDARVGKMDLLEQLQGREGAVVGISCGLSAAYVAGMLDYATETTADESLKVRWGIICVIGSLSRCLGVCLALT